MLATAHEIACAIDKWALWLRGRCRAPFGRSRNRISQLRTLTCLAPDVQEEILMLESVNGVEPITEKWVFENVARSIDWNEQRAAWRARSSATSA